MTEYHPPTDPDEIALICAVLDCKLPKGEFSCRYTKFSCRYTEFVTHATSCGWRAPISQLYSEHYVLWILRVLQVFADIRELFPDDEVLSGDDSWEAVAKVARKIFGKRVMADDVGRSKQAAQHMQAAQDYLEGHGLTKFKVKYPNGKVSNASGVDAIFDRGTVTDTGIVGMAVPDLTLATWFIDNMTQFVVYAIYWQCLDAARWELDECIGYWADGCGGDCDPYKSVRREFPRILERLKAHHARGSAVAAAA